MINIFLYTDNPSASFYLSKLISFLESFNFKVDNRDDFFSFLKLDENALDEYRKFLEAIKIRDIEKPLDRLNLNTAGSEFNENTSRENFFDGYWLQRKWYFYLSARLGREIEKNDIHLIFSGKLFGTFGERRYHARVILTGEPALISTSGVVEAPARPKEYYFAKGRLLSMGKGIGELDEIYKDRFVSYDDPKITNILCSYALQQIKSRITGDPFCENSNCCLFNSHWQEEVLALQYQNVICDECRTVLSNA